MTAPRRPSTYRYGLLFAVVTALLVFLQIGYLCGAALRMFVRPPRIVSERKRLPSS
jgi:hypothetical protein